MDGGTFGFENSLTQTNVKTIKIDGNLSSILESLDYKYMEKFLLEKDKGSFSDRCLKYCNDTITIYFIRGADSSTNDIFWKMYLNMNQSRVSLGADLPNNWTPHKGIELNLNVETALKNVLFFVKAIENNLITL